MSTAPSRRRNGPAERRFAALVTVFAISLGVCGSAHALKADRDQVVNINANHSVMNQDAGRAVLTGNVRIDQGSLHADGAQGTGYFDQNNTLQRVVLTGSPAHFQQKLDSGNMVNGSAASIDYQVSENTVILTGNANVVQQGRGEFHGAKLTYNTDTGQIVGDSSAGGQVHMTFRPKAKPAAAKPAPASAPAPTATPAPASSAGTH